MKNGDFLDISTPSGRLYACKKRSNRHGEWLPWQLITFTSARCMADKEGKMQRGFGGGGGLRQSIMNYPTFIFLDLIRRKDTSISVSHEFCVVVCLYKLSCCLGQNILEIILFFVKLPFVIYYKFIQMKWNKEKRLNLQKHLFIVLFDNLWWQV